MAKKQVHLTEATLHNIIKRSVKNILKEGYAMDDSNMDKWDELTQLLDAKTIVDGIYNYLDSDQLNELLHNFDDDYGLGLFSDEYEEDGYDDYEDEGY